MRKERERSEEKVICGGVEGGEGDGLRRGRKGGRGVKGREERKELGGRRCVEGREGE